MKILKVEDGFWWLYSPPIIKAKLVRVKFETKIMKSPLLNNTQRMMILKFPNSFSAARYKGYLAKMKSIREFEKIIMFRWIKRLLDARFK